jgi:hypothetical protein
VIVMKLSPRSRSRGETSAADLRIQHARFLRDDDATRLKRDATLVTRFGVSTRSTPPCRSDCDASRVAKPGTSEKDGPVKRLKQIAFAKTVSERQIGAICQL